MHDVVKYLKEKYNWYVAPNPTQDESYLRVSHMGNLTLDNIILLAERIDEACLFLTKSHH